MKSQEMLKVKSNCRHIAVYRHSQIANNGKYLGDYKVILCASPKTLQALIDANCSVDQIIIVIGETTSKRAMKLGFRNVFKSDETTFESMVKKTRPMAMEHSEHEVDEKFCDGDTCVI